MKTFKCSPYERASARERMRRLRANGLTIHDRARNSAVVDLIHRHKPEFDQLVTEHKNRLREVA